MNIMNIWLGVYLKPMLSLCKELRNATGVMAVETLATIREGFVSPSVVATATDLP